ncbi:hypothetical protein ACIOHE_15805 [Streptomyces sp. NPDC087851]|uniref:hypothetical protein n=1 Tax=Streptomyces sp. NPDC087851 TaxID=3365810 RepID=UPI003821223B
MTDHAAAARRHRAYEGAFATGSFALAATALWHAAHQTWLPALFFSVGGLYFAVCSARSGADYRRARVRAAGGTTTPCCAAWTASHHTVHGARCAHTNPSENPDV